MKVLFLTKYDQLAANTRYRCQQFIPYLEKRGIQCSVAPLLGDEYLKFKFASGRFRVGTVLKAYWNRLKLLTQLHKYDTVVLHYELFPYLPAVFERILSIFKINYVYDFDDAIFHHYDGHRRFLYRFLLKNKIKTVIKNSHQVLAGNRYLAQYASQVSSKISIIPTVVDPERYRGSCVIGRVREPGKPFTIGWVGSPSTLNYVIERAQAFRLFCLKHNARLILVGSGKVELPGVPTTIVDWSEENELEELKKFDVGIMPLRDDRWSRGKCGFKLIQYMACGLPVVASPIGVNAEIVEHGKNGYLATTDEEWIQALEDILNEPNKAAEMGRRGLEKVQSQYSLNVYAPKVAEALLNSLGKLKDAVPFGNIDLKVAENFGREWTQFPQGALSKAEIQTIFQEYFDIFPWEKLPKDGGVGFDLGCGSGRWATLVAPRVRQLSCLDASRRALDVAQSNLAQFSNVDFHHASVGEIPCADASLDFAYSIGVLHHIPDTLAGIQAISRKLKPGAPFLVYIYYAFDNRGPFYKFLWKISDFGRIGISRMPFPLKYWISQLLAILVYWPLARIAKILSTLGILPSAWTLQYYRDKAFYVMRTDAFDRFGTRLEQRYTRKQIQEMLENSGFKDVKFSNSAPYWVAVGIKA